MPDENYLIKVKDYMQVKIVKTPLILLSTGEDYAHRENKNRT